METTISYSPNLPALTPDWGESDIDEAACIAAIEQSRRDHFAELASL